MQQFSKFGIILGVIIAILLIMVINHNKTSEIKEIKLISGPFSINNSKYKIGENMFLVVDYLSAGESGRILIITPNEKIYSNIKFNGSNKSNFKKYFKPILSKDLDMCNMDKLVGEWKMILQGVKYHNMYVDVINEVSKYEINKYKKIC